MSDRRCTILDYRDHTVKEVDERDVAFMAPELYIYVEVSNEYDQVYKYQFIHVEDSERRLDIMFTHKEFTLAPITFDEFINMKLRAADEDPGKWEIHRRTVYLRQETIDEINGR